MRIELPLIWQRRTGRLVEAKIPGFALKVMGTSEAALRDDMALLVMQRFEHMAASEARRFQRAPHQRLRIVGIDRTVRDAGTGTKRELQGDVSVLLEKWPADDFWVATPVELPSARFALRSLEALEPALTARLVDYAVEHDLTSLQDVRAARDEKLDILEVDVYPPTILPRAPEPRPRPRRQTAGEQAKKTAAETPAEREERRQRCRLNAVTLREVARNLSYGADDDTLDHAFGREALVEQVTEELLGREGAAIVLVGPSGAGKTAVVHEIVRRLHARGRAAGVRQDVWRVDGGRFIAGMKYVGQWERRAGALAEELAGTGDILFADDLASLIYSGRCRTSDTNVARFLQPHLARGDISILAESTPERLERVREDEPTFAALFRVVHVPSMGELETLRVLLGVLRDLEADSSAGLPPRLGPDALDRILVGAQRFRPHEVFPGKAVRLLRRVLSGGGRAAAGKPFRYFEPEHVHATLHADTGLPPFVLGAEPPRPREVVRGELGGMIAGQREALDAITDVVLTLQTGLHDPDKPLATLLFVGPTGVGKTETARALARYLYGSPDRMLRFDMSELSSPASIARLVGEAGGVDGELTAALRSQPFRVILFDEIEKAHPRVFDALLQLLGEGRISDASGRVANAGAAVILLTSNLGVREAAARSGFAAAGQGAREHYIAAVRSFFRPEFFNRIDRIVPFAALDRSALRVVVEHALGELLSRRGIQRGNVLVDVEPELLDALVEQAYDPRYGARPLRRTLERRLTIPLAHHLVTRRGEDRALVELYRRGAGLGMAVRLLADAAPAPADELDIAGASLSRLRAAISAMRVDAAALSTSVELERWPELGQELESLSAELAALEEDELAETQFVEKVDESRPRLFTRWEMGYGDHHAGRGGLRPRVGFKEERVSLSREVLLRQVRPRAATLRGRWQLLRHRLNGASSGPDRPATLLLECTGTWDGEALQAVARACLVNIFSPQRWEEVATAEGGPAWRVAVTGAPDEVRRIALGYSGPGVRALVERLAGWALMETMRDGVAVSIPVRIELINGIGPSVVEERDGKVAAERAARRAAGPDASLAENAAVVFRRAAGQRVPTAVATGDLVDGERDEVALAAAFARVAVSGVREEAGR